MRVTLIHGRSEPHERLSDWGFDGPVIDGVAWVTMTYLSSLRIGFVTKAAAIEAHARTGWDWADALILEAPLEDGLVSAPSAPNADGGVGAWFGDWSVDRVADDWLEALPFMLTSLARGERQAVLRRLGEMIRPHSPEAADALEFSES